MSGFTPAPQGLFSEFRTISLIFSLSGVKVLPSGQVQVGDPEPGIKVQLSGFTPAPQGLFLELRTISLIFSLSGVKVLPSGQVQVGAPEPGLKVQLSGFTPAPQGLLSEFRTISLIFSLSGVKVLPSGQVQVGAPAPPKGRLTGPLKFKKHSFQEEFEQNKKKKSRGGCPQKNVLFLIRFISL